jgi:hypothetical protein
MEITVPLLVRPPRTGRTVVSGVNVVRMKNAVPIKGVSKEVPIKSIPVSIHKWSCEVEM